VPEMLRLSLSDLALRIKILDMNIGTSIEDVLSRALDPPSSKNIQRAVSTLVEVKALTPGEEITPMGRLLSKLPMDVHLGKFLLMSAIFKCLDPALTIAATLNSKSPFLSPFGYENEAATARNGFKVDNSDFLTIHCAFSGWRRVSNTSGNAAVRTFCRKHYLSHQNLQQIEELRQQLLGYLIDSGFIQVTKEYQQDLSRARYGRRKTQFISVPEEYDVNGEDSAVINAALCSGFFPQILCVTPVTLTMQTLSNNRQAVFHPSSVNFDPELLKPERVRKPRNTDIKYWCFFNLLHTKMLYASETGPVDNLAMLLLCGEVDFKLFAELASVDRKINYRFGPKTAVALKVLREQMASILSLQMRGKSLDKVQMEWYELAMQVLKHLKL